MSKIDTFPLQRYALAVGDSGCYFLCVIKAAEIFRCKTIDPLRTYKDMIAKKFKSTPWMNSDCFMNYPGLVLGDLIKREVTVRKEFDLSYKPKENEILIGCYEWFDKSINKTRQHFANLDDNKNCVYDPKGDSNTIKFGKLVSLRVFTIK